MSKFLKTFWADESGISSVEYALLLAFVAAGVALAAGNLGTAVTTAIDTACQSVNNNVAC